MAAVPFTFTLLVRKLCTIQQSPEPAGEAPSSVARVLAIV